MDRISLPSKVSFQEISPNRYQLVLEPLYPGYGMTLGNSLRRILLSSLPGAAVTSVKIRGLDHEFSTIPNVKEDVIEIILNLKQLRMKVHSDEPVKLELKVKGEKEVKASDFKKNSQVEIVNPDLHIAQLDNKSADFEMEVTVGTGRGYVPVEQRENEKLEIGSIAVDAIYTPVRNVNFEIKHVRVGQITNYDELVMTMDTDGTMDGKTAIDIASRVLLDHFSLLTSGNLEAREAADGATSVPPGAVAEEGIKTPEEDDLKSLGLSNRSYNALIKNNINRISQLQSLSHDDLMNLEGLGDKSIEEIERLLAGYTGK